MDIKSLKMALFSIAFTALSTPLFASDATGDAEKGKAFYSAKCAMCHGQNPSANQNKILNGKTIEGVDAALAKVGIMAQFKSLSADDKSNISAYIASTVAE